MLCAKPPATARGTAPRRTSDAITIRQQRALHRALDRALQMGLRGTFVTINWCHTRWASNPMEGLQAIRHHVHRWARRNHGTFAAVWVRENVETGIVGEHAHIIVLMKTSLLPAFESTFPKWVAVADPSGLNIKRCGSDRSYDEKSLLLYLLKGGNAAVRQSIGQKSERPQGSIEGKRVGATLNIGPAVRASASVW